jgi:hypothetical protein
MEAEGTLKPVLQCPSLAINKFTGFLQRAALLGAYSYSISFSMFPELLKFIVCMFCEHEIKMSLFNA